MQTKHKLLLIFLTIITFGLYLFWIKSSQKRSRKPSQIPFDLQVLKSILGNDNVEGVQYYQSKVKFFVKSSARVDLEKIKALKGVSGAFATSKTVTIIVGPIAKTIATRFEE